MAGPTFNTSFESSGLELSAYLREPPADVPTVERSAMILCHGFPVAPLDARRSAGTYPGFIDRIVDETGYVGMTFTFRGCGTSKGDFSLQGWVDDLRAAINHLTATTGIEQVTLVGTTSGGSIAVCVAADDPRVNAVATMSSRADFDDWADHPRRFLDHARAIGAIQSPDFPPTMDEWRRGFRRFRPTSAARRFAPRPLLVLHGADDPTIPTSDARQIAQAHGSAELKVLSGAGNRLRHDPRAVSLLLGWLERVRSA